MDVFPCVCVRVCGCASVFAVWVIEIAVGAGDLHKRKV